MSLNPFDPASWTIQSRRLWMSMCMVLLTLMVVPAAFPDGIDGLSAEHIRALNDSPFSIVALLFGLVSLGMYHRASIFAVKQIKELAERQAKEYASFSARFEHAAAKQSRVMLIHAEAQAALLEKMKDSPCLISALRKDSDAEKAVHDTFQRVYRELSLTDEDIDRLHPGPAPKEPNT